MSHALYMTQPITILSFYLNSDNIWWQVQFMKLYIMQFSFLLHFPITFNHKTLDC